MANGGPFKTGGAGSGRIFEDLARVAGGALGAAGGLKADIEALVRTQAAKMINELDLVRREDFEAARAMAAKARAEQDIAESRMADLEARIMALEAKQTSGEASE